ncbi:MAG: hypothetical protein L3J19_02425 [Sulfurimonas sp.]|nr:hypothetical protein [Sulfurimonas sp.]
MQKLILLFLFLALTSALSAAGHRDRGLFGSLGFLYSEDETTNTGSTRSRENFTNKLNLGYIGNIYSPRLLQYTLKGSIRSDKLKDETSSQKTDSNDYGIELNFIKGTKFPFRIYANQQNSPISTQYANFSTSYIYESQAQGISGSVNLTPYQIAYGMSNIKGVSEYADNVQNTQNSSYFGTFDYSTKAHQLSIKYKHNEEENVQNYLNNSVTSVNQVKDKVDLSYKTDISEDLKLNSDASYETDEYYETTRMDARADLRWTPKRAKYDATLSVNSTQLQYQEANTTEQFNAININQTLNYRLSSSINLAQSAMIYTFDTPTVKGVNTNLNLAATHAYTRTVFDDAKFNLTTNLIVQKNDTTTKESKDGNSTNTSTAVERYTFNLNAGVTKELPSIESNLNISASTNMSTSSEDYQQQRFSFNAALVSRLFAIVNNNLAAAYSITSTSNTGVSSSYSSSSLRDALNFNFRLGMRGRIAFNFGMEYINMVNDEESTSQVNPMMNVNLNYRFFRRLMFSSRVSVKQYYDTLDYAGNANLVYEAGKTHISMSYQYNKTETQSETRKLEVERTLLKIQLIRRF